jgi:hypothetical protein
VPQEAVGHRFQSHTETMTLAVAGADGRGVGAGAGNPVQDGESGIIRQAGRETNN